MPAILGRYRILTILLIAALLTTPFAGAASAAETAVVGIEFEQSSNVYLYVEQDTKQLKVFAELSGQASKVDVTAEAFWASSQPAIVKVEKGLLTPLKKGTAQISAKYAGMTITLTATADYLFKKLELSPAETIEIDLGDTLQVDAIAVDSDDDAYTVSTQAVWTSSNAQIVTVEKGLLTPVGKGKATITAKHKGLSASVSVQVSSPYTSMKIETDESLELLVGQSTVQLNALAVIAANEEEDVTENAQWATSNANIVAVEKGELTAKSQGTAKITASYLGVTHTVTVIVRLPFQALKLNPSKDISFFVNEAPVLLTAEVLNDIDSGINVTTLGTWTSSNPVAVSLSVAPEGASITPKSAGSSVIKFEHRGLSKELRATVYPTITAIQTELTELQLYKDETLKLPVVEGKTLAGTFIELPELAMWSSSDTDIIELKDGKIKAVSPGKATLTAAVRSFTVTIKVTVQEKVLVLLPEVYSIGLVVGTESGFPKVRAVLEDGTELEDISDQIKWKSSSTSLLIKDDRMKSLLSGRATLTGTYLNSKIAITVSMEPEISKFIITPVIMELNPGRSKLIQVKGVYKDGKTVSLSSKIEWTSSNSELVSVNRSTVKAIEEGTVALTAMYQGKPLTVTVKVVPKLKKLTADKTTLNLKTGSTGKIVVKALYDTGKEVTITADAIWSSSNSSIAGVDKTGTIRAVKKGSTTIKAVYQNKSVSIRVKVE